MASNAILIFGGSGGIGASTARLAAKRGMKVAFTYASNEAAAEGLAAEIGGQAIACDVASSASVSDAFARAMEAAALDAVVFASGITGPASTLAEASDQTLEEVTAVNLIGAMKVGREAIHRLGSSHGGPGGSIVFVSSRASQYGAAGEYVWYAASKGGLDSFVNGMAKEAAEEDVRVNLVSPGPVATGMISPERQALGAARTALRRVGQPTEVAEAILFLLSPAASYITGANLAVSGGA